MNYDSPPVESKLSEILGYLNILGKNIQKRTQYLLANKINSKYLRNEKNLENIIEKVNTICKMSEMSLNKVNNGVKITIENEMRKRKAPNEQGMKMEILNIEDSSLDTSRCDEKLEEEKPSVEEGELVKHIFKKVTVNNVVFLIPEDVELNAFTSCRVRLSFEESSVVDEFAKKMQDSAMSLDVNEKDNEFKVSKNSPKGISRIKSRPKHLKDSPADENSKNVANENVHVDSNNSVYYYKEHCKKKKVSGPKRDKCGAEFEMRKTFRRIIHSDSSDEDIVDRNLFNSYNSPDASSNTGERKISLQGVLSTSEDVSHSDTTEKKLDHEEIDSENCDGSLKALKISEKLTINEKVSQDENVKEKFVNPNGGETKIDNASMTELNESINTTTCTINKTIPKEISNEELDENNKLQEESTNCNNNNTVASKDDRLSKSAEDTLVESTKELDSPNKDSSSVCNAESTIKNTSSCPNGDKSMETVLEMCNQILEETSLNEDRASIKETESNSLVSKETDSIVHQTEGTSAPCLSPPLYPSENEGFGDDLADMFNGGDVNDSGEKKDGDVNGSEEKKDGDVNGSEEKKDGDVNGSEEKKDGDVNGSEEKKDGDVNGSEEKKNGDVNGSEEKKDGDVNGSEEKKDGDVNGSEEKKDGDVNGSEEKKDGDVNGSEEKKDGDVNGSEKKKDGDVNGSEEKTEETNAPLIRCVNINSLLAKNINEDNLNNSKQSPKKNVTFLETPVRLKKSKMGKERSRIDSPKKPTSILVNKKSTYVNCWSNKSIELSDSDDSDVSNTNRELLKNIKNNILQKKSESFVSVARDTFHSEDFTNSLRDYGVKKMYNEFGKLCFSRKQKQLNEDAKKYILSSSSSSNSDSSIIKKKLSTIEKRKKKFTKKRRRKDISDSEVDIRSLLNFSMSKKRRKHEFSSDESSDNNRKGKHLSSSDDEMGRSARLKQRETPTAFTQSNKDRNASDSSTSNSTNNSHAGSSHSKLIKKNCNVLLEALVNGINKNTSSETDQSSAAESTSKSKHSAKSPSAKPLAEKIKNDLLDDETSSSAQESTPKVNGKEKEALLNEDIKKVLIEDSEEELNNDSDIEEEKIKRPTSTINLDTDSEEEIKVPKSKIKKATQNGKKNSDGSDGEADAKEKGGKSGSGSDESEIFVPRKRKRKPKKKSSSGSEEENSQDSESESTKKKRKRIKKVSGDESSANDDDDSDGDGNKKGRKNIRALKKTSHLDSATREAAKRERERVARVAERQKLYNESMFDESGGPEEIAKLDKVVLDFDPKTKDPIIVLDRGLVGKLKPHQANGIKFMWDACFESVKQINTGKGSGCILAHCMGLGKTLQVVTLVHSLLLHREKTKVERVLVVCPLSTVLNWVNEFNMWLEHAEDDSEINIFELSRYKQNHERAYQLKEWLECGGVCILGYDMFRNLSADNSKKFRKAQLTSFQKALVDPGPDLVVCDEGHLLKNEKTSLSQSMNKVKTLRRIVLTGTPLQNNLKEYYCMVQFVKPNLLGKYSEYLNRFVNPITNGQYTNSTDYDIKIMKRRSHVLHKMLDGAVQRRDYAVLAPFLPPKNEYVLFISLTEIQVKLYRHYLENYSRRPNPEKKTTPSLFSDFQSLQRIWTHPLILKANSERYELMQQKKRDKEEEEDSEGSLIDFIDDEEDTTTPEESSMSESEDSDESDRPRRKPKKKNTKAKPRRVTRATAVTTTPKEEEDEDVQELKVEEPKLEEPKLEETKLENPTEWWISLCSDDELNDIRHSNKLLLLLDILKECEAIGDKLLVFSQSLYSLDLIEQFLAKIDEATQKGTSDEHLCGHSGSWAQGLDYFRLDGSSSCENRSIWCKAFNREDNPRARLFLISTRAGGLGINLVAANRVVIFDMSWNPSHDVQSIFRVYRFGQKKPCYIYRFLALGTMEEKIYERQVTKQAISKRVIDEQQIDRHYTESDLAELYKFCPEPEGSREVPLLPKDRLFADLLKRHDTVIYKYHEHDSLLENKEEETLTEEERKAAWEDYENEKKRPPPTFGGANWLMMQQQQQQQQMTINALQAVLRQDYPTLTEQQITAMIPAIMQQMHNNGDAALTQKLTAMMAAQNNMMGGQMLKYNPNMMSQGMMMNPGGMGMGIRNSMYQQVWQQQQQQLQMQRLQQQQAMQTNMKYYAGGLGSRDLMDMAALQQQQRALLLGNVAPSTRGRPPKTLLRPPRPAPNEIVDLDSE